MLLNRRVREEASGVISGSLLEFGKVILGNILFFS